MISEPSVIAPEAVFEAAVTEVVRDLVRDLGCDCVVVPRFGLDVALFLGNGGHSYSRFLEAKVYAAGRPGGVGFGSPTGQGPQVELLLCSEKDLALLDTSVRWILADATRQPGTKRYALFDCQRAKEAAMVEVRKGKQNNLKISAIQDCFVTWNKLVAQLRDFLFEPVGGDRLADFKGDCRHEEDSRRSMDYKQGCAAS